MASLVFKTEITVFCSPKYVFVSKILLIYV